MLTLCREGKRRFGIHSRHWMCREIFDATMYLCTPLRGRFVSEINFVVQNDCVTSLSAGQGQGGWNQGTARFLFFSPSAHLGSLGLAGLLGYASSSPTRG